MNSASSCWDLMLSSSTGRKSAEWSQNCPVDSDEIRRREDEILNIFVDICSLFQRDPEVNHRASSEEPSAEAYLFSYLRMLETRGEGLPPAFVEALRRTLAHYGVQTLDRSPELEESLLWIYKSHQRVEQQVAPVLGVLERRLRRVQTLSPHAKESFRTLLDRMASMTNGLFPPSATSPVNCAIAASSRRCLSRHVNRSTRKRKITSPIWPPIRMPRTATRESARWLNVRSRWSAYSPAGSLPRTRHAQVDAGSDHLALLPHSNLINFRRLGRGRALLCIGGIRS